MNGNPQRFLEKVSLACGVGENKFWDWDFLVFARRAFWEEGVVRDTGHVTREGHVTRDL
jgi:hypothetical protein